MLWLTIISKVIIGGFVMAVSSRLLGEWADHYKNYFMEISGRLVFWGGGSALAAVIGGMPFEHALAIIPTGIAGIIIPTPDERDLQKFGVIAATVDLVVRAVISFIPLMFILWVYGYFWPKLILAAACFPLIYAISKTIPSTIWNMTRGSELNDVMIGFLLGVDIVISIMIPWSVWPPLPHFMTFIDN